MLSMADEVPLIFTPDNEAYLGLPWVHELDLLISSSAVLSQKVGVSSRMTDLNDSRLLYLKSRHLFLVAPTTTLDRAIRV